MATSMDQSTKSALTESNVAGTTSPDASAKPKSKQRILADEFVRAFNDMDVERISSLRSPSCLRYILPSTLNQPVMDNMTFTKSLHHLKAIFHNFSLTVHDVIEDESSHRIWLYLTARADTVVGEYVNEYVWFLTFDKDATCIIESKEFVDTIMNRDFFPKLAKAMKEQQAKAASAETNGTA